jgi:hypothetical protein
MLKQCWAFLVDTLHYSSQAGFCNYEGSMQSEICRLALTFEVYKGIASVVVVGLSDLVFGYTTTRNLRLALLYYMLLHRNGSKHKGEVVDKKRTFKTYAC